MPKFKGYRRKRKKMTAGKQALKKVNKLIKANETKHRTLVQNINDTSWLGEIIILNAMPQGIGDTNRIGDKVQITSVWLKYCIDIGDNSLRSGNTIRVLLFWDKQNNVPLTADVLSLVGTVEVIDAHYIYDNIHAFQILYDKKFDCIQNSDQQIHSINRRIRMKNKYTQFFGGTTNIVTGSLKLMLISNVDTLSPNSDKPNIIGSVRVFYNDS